MGPGLFSAIGQKSRDLLDKDFTSDQRITINSSSGNVLDLNSTLVNKGRLSSGDLTAKFRCNNSTVDVKVDTESKVLTTVTIPDIVQSTKTIASIQLPDYSLTKLEVQYLHDHVAFTTAVGLNQSPPIDFSATIGTPTIAFGAEMSFSTATGKFSKYNAGVSLTNPNSSTSVILADKGDSLRASYLQHLDHLNGGAVVGEISRRFSTNENTLTVGCSYVINGQTFVKAKLNNHGNLSALLQHEVIPKSFLTISGAFQTQALERSPKFGLALALKP
ncbi:mitochondrial outer membrane protein porin 2-like isoform X2 [Neltuma alba]|uniref:mitochondrial outer membrane protein porin 2-like isoform X2 n=1 Tax=Neltuma alba TaxID=207710 RepID=UPI0010A48AB2|nr:mitochondrial outer membrane protein porin 2-like isoform X2 [Prosopis alba]XP_028806927.1 mitochondrial outer membrane protein porin 2-like isoform X2 [Prosopis alba]